MKYPRTTRWLMTSALLFAVNGGAQACTDPPCNISTSACSLSSGSVKRDLINPFSITLEFCLTNIDGPCGGSPVTIPNIVIAQLDSFGDATASLTGFPAPPFDLPVDTTLCGDLTLTFPSAAAAGERSFGVCLRDPNCPNSPPDCVATVNITETVSVVPIEPGGCALPGLETKRFFRVSNCTGIARTVDFSVTSIQTTTTASEDGDHFPISICPAPVPPGDPLDPVPPVLASTVNVPAGVGSFVDIAIASASFPGCHPGSACKYRLVATDQATGEESIAESTLMVINSTWNKIDSPLAGNVGENVLSVNPVIPPSTDPCVVVGVGDPVTVQMDAPTAGPVQAKYVLWVWPVGPTAPTFLNVGQTVLGYLANPVPLTGGGPQPFRCVRGGLPNVVCSGVTQVNGPALAPWSLTKNSGIAQPVTFTLQGLIEDQGANNQFGFSVTNAIVLKVQ